MRTFWAYWVHIFPLTLFIFDKYFKKKNNGWRDRRVLKAQNLNVTPFIGLTTKYKPVQTSSYMVNEWTRVKAYKKMNFQYKVESFTIIHLQIKPRRTGRTVCDHVYTPIMLMSMPHSTANCTFPSPPSSSSSWIYLQFYKCIRYNASSMPFKLCRPWPRE